jgi:hypothetical protein
MGAKKLISLILSSSLVLWVTTCKKDFSATNTSTKIESDVLIPLKVGNYWNYEATYYSSTDSVRYAVKERLTVHYEGHHYEAFFAAYNNANPNPRWLYWNGADGLYSMGGLSETDTMIFPVLQFKYPVEKGETWEVSRMVYNLVEQRFYIKDTLTYTCIDNDSSIVTPSATFQTVAYMFKVSQGDDVLLKEKHFFYYAPRIGLIKHEIKNESGTLIKAKMVLYSYYLY